MIRLRLRTGAGHAVAVLIMLVAASFAISRVTTPSPRLDTITPSVISPGQVLRLQGRFFGSERGAGIVTFSDQEPRTFAYRLWSDRRIEIVVPASFSSGLVRVVTREGVSDGLLLTRRSDFPRPVAGERVPGGPPKVTAVSPAVAAIGEQITISGVGFGSSRAGGAVSFTARSDPGYSGFAVESSSVDFDNVRWSDRQIVVRVPAGAHSGSVWVRTSNSVSDAHDFQVRNEVGSVRHVDPRSYEATYAVSVAGMHAAADASVYLWIPVIPETPAQWRETESSVSSQPVYRDQAGVEMFQIHFADSSSSHEVRRNYRVRRYAIRTSIESSNVRVYRRDTAFYARFTSGDAVVPSGGRLPGIATRAIRGYVNPLWRARMIFQYVVARLQPVSSGVARVAPAEAQPMEVVLAAIDEQRAAPYEYAVTFSAIARAVGIPARPVAGYLIGADKRAVPHYWAEFYLQDFGWVPVDPAADDGAGGAVLLPAVRDVDDANRFFGNLDSHRIALAKGVFDPQRIARARRVMHPELAGLQTAHEDVVGEPTGYLTHWLGLGIAKDS